MVVDQTPCAMGCLHESFHAALALLTSSRGLLGFLEPPASGGSPPALEVPGRDSPACMTPGPKELHPPAPSFHGPAQASVVMSTPDTV